MSDATTGYTCQQIVTSESGARESCDRPLTDTEYVCQRCVRQMRFTLARCYSLWTHVEAVVGRSLHLGGAPGMGTRSGRSGIHGPYCAASMLCEHESCMTLYKQAGRMKNEPAIPNEDALLINPDALEDQWAIGNTLTTWARLLSEETGLPIPEWSPARLAIEELAAPLIAEERCEFSDLPTKPALQCACNHPRRSHP